MTCPRAAAVWSARGGPLRLQHTVVPPHYVTADMSDSTIVYANNTVRRACAAGCKPTVDRRARSAREQTVAFLDLSSGVTRTPRQA
jgi:hypothetical protein